MFRLVAAVTLHTSNSSRDRRSVTGEGCGGNARSIWRHGHRRSLPHVPTLWNTFEGCDDPTGTTDSPWAKWSCGWKSEENRHGDLLNKHLYLSGRCDMQSVEVTIQHLNTCTNRFNPDAQKDPHRRFVYTSFQERGSGRRYDWKTAGHGRPEKQPPPYICLSRGRRQV